MDIRGLHKMYVRGTAKKAVVQVVTILVCRLTAAVVSGASCLSDKVYISTRVIKHVYDKRPAEEFDTLIANVRAMVKYPDRVYRNVAGKRGEYCFVKSIDGLLYLCALEMVERPEQGTVYEIATLFRVDEDYLKKHELLWEWKGGDLHRSAFDTGRSQPNSTPQ